MEFVYLITLILVLMGLYWVINKSDIAVSEDGEWWQPSCKVFSFTDDRGVFYIAAADKHKAVEFACELFTVNNQDLFDEYSIDEVPWFKWGRITYIDPDTKSIMSIEEFMKNKKDNISEEICTTYR